MVSPSPRRGRSLAVRLLLAFLALAAVFGGIVAWGLIRSRAALQQVHLLDGGYLRLALTAAELRATQSIVLTLLDRILEESDPAATRSWLEAAGRLRPERLERLERYRDRVAALASTEEDRAAAHRLGEDVTALRREAAAADRAFADFLAALDTARLPDAARLRTLLLDHERSVDRRLRAVGRAADRTVADLSRNLEHVESRTFWMLLGLALVAAAIAAGILVFVHSTVAPLRTLERAVEAVARGDLTRRVGLDRNDEIGRLAAQFDRMTAAIRERDERLRLLRQEEKLAALGRMAAHVSHEVRNPLSSIGLNVELLEEELRRLDAASPARALLGAVAREVDRLTRVTESYLSLARMPRPEPVDCDLGETVRRAAEFHRGQVEAAGARLELRLEPVPRIAADPDQIRQILDNLLRNALEAVAAGPERLLILGVRPTDGAVEVSVTDSGPGVAEESRSRLFEPFFSTRPRGTGIGLAASRQIALAHRGTLEFDPLHRPGARFVLRLPRPDAADAPPDA